MENGEATGLCEAGMGAKARDIRCKGRRLPPLRHRGDLARQQAYPVQATRSLGLVTPTPK